MLVSLHITSGGKTPPPYNFLHTKAGGFAGPHAPMLSHSLLYAQNAILERKTERKNAPQSGNSFHICRIYDYFTPAAKA